MNKQDTLAVFDMVLKSLTGLILVEAFTGKKIKIMEDK